MPTPDAKTEGSSRYQRLRGYLASDPSNLTLALDTAAAAREAGDLQSEQEVLRDIAEKHPDNSALTFALGTNALNRRDFRYAEVCFDSMLAGGTEHPAIRYNLAFARFYGGDYEAVLRVLDPMSEADWAQVPQAHKLYAQAAHHVDEDDLSRSISHLERYLATHQDEPEARGLLALAYFDDDRNEDAERQLLAALQRQPGEPNALLVQGGLALERQDQRLAQESFQTIIDVQPHNGRAWSGLAFAHLLNLDFPTATEAFGHAVEHMPDHIGTWHGLAWLQILSGDLLAAEASFGKALAIDRNFGDTHGGLAVVAAMQGRTDECRRMIRRALGLNPLSFPARYAESILLAKVGDGEKSAEIVRQLLTSSPSEGGASVELLVAALLERRAAYKP